MRCVNTVVQHLIHPARADGMEMGSPGSIRSVSQAACAVERRVAVISRPLLFLSHDRDTTDWICCSPCENAICLSSFRGRLNAYESPPPVSRSARCRLKGPLMPAPP